MFVSDDLEDGAGSCVGAGGRHLDTVKYLIACVTYTPRCDAADIQPLGGDNRHPQDREELLEGLGEKITCGKYKSYGTELSLSSTRSRDCTLIQKGQYSLFELKNRSCPTSINFGKDVRQLEGFMVCVGNFTL